MLVIRAGRSLRGAGQCQLKRCRCCGASTQSPCSSSTATRTNSSISTNASSSSSSPSSCGLRGGELGQIAQRFAAVFRQRRFGTGGQAEPAKEATAPVEQRAAALGQEKHRRRAAAVRTRSHGRTVARRWPSATDPVGCLLRPRAARRRPAPWPASHGSMRRHRPASRTDRRAVLTRTWTGRDGGFRRRRRQVRAVRLRTRSWPGRGSREFSGCAAHGVQATACRTLPGTLTGLGSVRPLSSLTVCVIGLIAGLLSLGIGGDAAAVTRDFYFERLGSERGLAQNTVNALVQDAQGFVWVATQGGLHRYDGQRYTQYRHDPRDPASLPDSYVTALAPEGDQALWVGSYSQYVSRLDLTNGRIRRYRRRRRRPGQAAGDGAAAACRQGLGRHRGGVGTPGSGIRHARPGDYSGSAVLRGWPMQALLAAPDGAIWYGCATGLYRIGPRGGVERMRPPLAVRSLLRTIAASCGSAAPRACIGWHPTGTRCCGRGRRAIGGRSSRPGGSSGPPLWLSARRQAWRVSIPPPARR